MTSTVRTADRPTKTGSRAEDTQTRLEALQAEIKLETGRKITQQELVDRLVDQAFESRDEFIDSFRADDDWDGLSEDEIE